MTPHSIVLQGNCITERIDGADMNFSRSATVGKGIPTRICLAAGGLFTSEGWEPGFATVDMPASLVECLLKGLSLFSVLPQFPYVVLSSLFSFAPGVIAPIAVKRYPSVTSNVHELSVEIVPHGATRPSPAPSSAVSKIPPLNRRVFIVSSPPRATRVPSLIRTNCSSALSKSLALRSLVSSICANARAQLTSSHATKPVVFYINRIEV